MSIARGFVSVPVLLLVIGLLVLGGGVYYVQQEKKLDTTKSTPTASTDTNTISSREARPLNIPYTCYAKTASAVYAQDNIPPTSTFTLSSAATKIEGADVSSFKEAGAYDICFGVDSHHVYKNTSVLSWADPATFKLLWYAKPGPVLFFRNGSKIFSYAKSTGSFLEIVNGDPATFETITGGYDFAPWAKDKNQVYCNGAPIAHSNPTTTKLLNHGTQLSIEVNGTVSLYEGSCKTTGSSGASAVSPAYFAPASGARFTLHVGESATDGPDGVTLLLSSVSSGIVSVAISGKLYATPYLVSGAVGGTLAASGKSMVTAGDRQFPSGSIDVSIVSINGNAVTFEVADAKPAFSG